MNKRFHELDALRGIAALIVVLYHAYMILDSPPAILTYSPIRLFISGHASVVFFFLLSGYVLSLPFQNGKPIRYSEFLIRRICRIWLPYLSSIALAIACKQLFYSPRSVNEWAGNWWRFSVTPALVLQHVTMLGEFPNTLNPAIWSLVQEMRISLIFPFLMLLIVRLSVKRVFLLAAFFAVATCFLTYLSFSSFVGTVHFTAFFVLGAMLAKMPPVSIKPVWLPVALLLFSYPVLWDPHVYGWQRDVIQDWLIATGAAIILLSARQDFSFKRFLLLAPFQFLGRISYSLYLVHLVVMLSLFYGTFFPVVWVSVLTVPIALVVATVMYYLVEKPAMQFGRWLTQNRRVTVIGYFTSNMSKN